MSAIVLQARRQPRRARLGRLPVRQERRRRRRRQRYGEDDLLPAIEAGAHDVTVDDDVFEVLTEPADLTAVRAALEEAGIELESAEVVQYPKTRVPLDEEPAASCMRLIDALEDNDDVDEVHGNFDVDAEILERVAG